MTEPSPHTIDFTATALHEHRTGPVAGNPHRLGKPLEAPLDNVWTTRRGDYRAMYSIDDRKHAITVLAVAHRRDAYRAR
jgi:mRNA interferase RelE/StbE